MNCFYYYVLLLTAVQLWDADDSKANESLGEVRVDIRTLPVNRATDTSDAPSSTPVPPPLESEEWYAPTLFAISTVLVLF
jgi:hypothetical protein